jgi:methylene-tetrahydromethanopterin dehydrogenase
MALDMAEAARSAMFPPFLVSVFADPSGAFTTAAAMVACVERRLQAMGSTLKGAKLSVFGAKGVVGGMAGVIAAEAGAAVTLVAHDASGVVEAKAKTFAARFQHSFAVVDGSTQTGRGKALADAEIVLSAGRAGVRTLSADDLAHAQHLRVAADVNAVPPLGIEGLDAKADGAPLATAAGVGIGALTIGNVKFRVQHRLLQRLHEAEQALFLDFRDAYRAALEIAP